VHPAASGIAPGKCVDKQKFISPSSR